MDKQDAVVEGIAEAARLGLTKPADVAICITVALKKHGFKIIAAPRRVEVR